MEDSAPRYQAVILDPLLERFGGLPKRATDGSAAMDLVACIEEPLTLAPQETFPIPAGFAMHIADPSVAAWILPRSGRGAKEGLVLANTVGLIDSDYQGPIVMYAFNRNPAGGKPVVIMPGERVFQMVFMPVVAASLLPVDAFAAGTARGTGGYGSTGK